MLLRDIRTYHCEPCCNTMERKLAVSVCLVEHPPTPIPCSMCQLPAPETTHTLALSDAIAAFSQALWLCSYNQEDVRGAWRNGKLDDLVKYHETGDEIRFRHRMDEFYRTDGQYQTALTMLVRAAGGWADKVCEWRPLSPLNIEEQRLVDAL